MSQHSRIPGFFAKTLPERAKIIAERISDPDLKMLLGGQTLSLEIAETLSENVVAVFGLPLSVATNFIVNRQEVLVPMAVEEPSVVAAASFGAKLARVGGGFFASSDPGEMIGQIELRGIPDLNAAATEIQNNEKELLTMVNELHARLRARGGGAVSLTLRPIAPKEGHAVCELLIDCRDAMGANLINTACEALAAPISNLTKGQVGLKILSNFCERRRARARVEIPLSTLPPGTGERISLASRFAERDTRRAVTHNKGFFNGVDSLVVATGNDWRAVECAAHAFAVRDGVYRPLSRWRILEENLIGEAEIPLALGTVGGATQAHPGARLAMEILGFPNARTLAEIAVSVGLAQNLAALRALATEGIQRGHMALHKRRLSPENRELPPPESRFSKWLSKQAKQINTALEGFFQERREEQNEEKNPEGLPALFALSEFTLRGGKRLRAALALLGYEIASGQKADQAALQASLSLEFLQSALLIQEDLIEGDTVRRGGPTLQYLLAEEGAANKTLGLRPGESRAIVVSDLAQSYSHQAILHAPFPAERRLAALEELLSLEKNVFGGKWSDLSLDPRDATEEAVLHAYELRTGRYTSSGPLRMGARLGGASPALLATLEDYARPIGLAFQIQDDLLRVFGDPSKTGHSSGAELRSARPRLLLVEALRHGNQTQTTRIRELLGKRVRSQDEIEELRDLLKSTGAKEAARLRALSLIDDAKKVMSQSSVREDSRLLLLDLADYVVGRSL